MRRSLILSAGLACAVSPLGCDISKVDVARLDVVRAGGGDGTIGSAQRNAIECGDDCAEAFPKGTTIRLIAIAHAGSQFAGWSGACTGVEPCDLTMDADRVVTALFESQTHRMTVSKTGVGDGVITTDPLGIDCGDKCVARFPFGTRLAFRATPNPGFVFAGWSGDCVGTRPCGVTLTTDRSLIARFEPDLVDLTVSKGGPGSGLVDSTPAGISCGTTCSGAFVRHTTISLRATPVAGSSFAGWSGACTGLSNCDVTLDAAKSVTAMFQEEKIPLTVSVGGAGTGSVQSLPAGIDCPGTCTFEFAEGSAITLEALLSSGNDFSGWAGDCGGNGACILTMNGPKTVVATFSVARHTLSIATDGAGRGRVSSSPGNLDCDDACDELFDHDSLVSVAATPEPGSTFGGWAGDCIGTSDCSVTVDGPRQVTATFNLLARRISVVRTGAGGGSVRSVPPGIDCGTDCEHSYDHNTQVTLYPTPEPGSRFVGWSGPCSGTGLCTIAASAFFTVGAQFDGDYVLIAATEFTMGSDAIEPGRSADEGPQRAVTFSSSFFLKTTEVTQAQWRQVMGTDPSSFTNCGDDCPVDSVDFDDAVAFVNRLSALEGLERCYAGGSGNWTFKGLHCAGYRIPTEAEWEHAARAGTTTPFYGGNINNADANCNADATLEALGWYCGNTILPRAVASKQANDFGLFDMHGNVAEWTNDRYDASYYATSSVAVDSTGPMAGAGRVVRGGSWNDPARDHRSAARAFRATSTPSNTVGLRPARTAFARVPASAFTMGSDAAEIGRETNESAHEVVITRPLYMRSVEVTQGEWRALMSTNPSRFNTCGDDCPVETVTWPDAVGYANAQSVRDGLTPCYTGTAPSIAFVGLDCDGYRLPTEAEWELGARAASAVAFATGDISAAMCADPALDQSGWYCGNAAARSHAGAEKTPNAWGLYDMNGNVTEWAHDLYEADYYTTSPRQNPTGPMLGTSYVVRGGAYDSTAAMCRAAARDEAGPLITDGTRGFRTVRAACEAPGFDVVATAGAPEGREDAAMVWTGERVLMFGGAGAVGPIASPAAYSPDEARWSAITTSGAPVGRTGHAAVWTSSRMLVWGGTSPGGGAYDPRVETWTPIETLGAPSDRRDFSHGWTGSEWVIWGGWDGTTSFADGARYVAAVDRWNPMARGPLSARWGAGAVWTGTALFIVGGRTDATQLADDFAMYNPSTDTWSTAATAGACSGRAKAYQAGDWIVVASETGWCRYQLSTGAWSSVATRPSGRALPSGDAQMVASTGAEIILYGGTASANDGVADAYDPGANSWRRAFSGGPAAARLGTPGIWTGCAMFIWSGANQRETGWLFRP